MFKKFIKALAEATTEEEINEILYSENGVDMMFQKKKIKWEEHQIIFKLASKILTITK